MAGRESIEISQAIAILRAASSLPAAVAQLEALQNPRVSAQGSDVRRHARGRSFYDRLIAEILDRVRQGVSREALVNAVIEMLRSEQSTDALGYLLLEANVDFRGGIDNLRTISSSGFHKARVENFSRLSAAQLSKSRLIQGVIAHREPLEFLPTELTRGTLYHGELDALFSDQRAGAWICGVPLPNADALQPARMLLAVYPALGNSTEPALPRGAPQEWRVFIFLSVAYELLNHQLTNVADVVNLQRREILSELAPGIVNHEINQHLTILDEGINIIHFSIERLAKELGTDSPDLRRAARGLAHSYSSINRLHQIGDAFNNLDRRAPNVRVTIRRLLNEVATLTHSRRAGLGIATNLSGDGFDVPLLTDPALLELVLLNIVMNALDAFRDDPDHHRAVPHPYIDISARLIGEHIAIVISNNGPPFALDRPEKIFERGVTTKPLGVGHGLGLFVCRLIMAHLNGQLEICGPLELPSDATLGFRITIPVTRVEIGDVQDAGTKSPLNPTAKGGRK